MSFPEKIVEQRRALPDSPGVYLFKDAGGRVLYVGKAKSIRKRVASHFSGPLGHALATSCRGSTRSTSSGRRTRPRRCWRSRTSSSSTARPSTSACGTTSPTPTSGSRSTRTFRASTSPASGTGRAAPTSGPSRAPSACGRRSTCSASSFRTAPARDREPGRASGNPCLDYYIKRCQAPCVDYISQRGLPRRTSRRSSTSSRAATARSSASSRPAWQAAAAEQEFEQAAAYRNRLRAVRSLFERQRVANESVGTVDVDRGRGRRDRRQRSGVPGARRRAGGPAELLPREPRRPQRGGGRGGVRAPVLRHLALDPGGDRRPAPRSPRRTGARGARGAPGGAGRAAPRAARRQAPASTSWPSETRGWRSSRTSSAPSGAGSSASTRSNDLREALALDALPVRIECFDVSNLGATHTVASMVVFEGGAPKKSDYRRFKIRGLTGARTTSPRWRRCSSRRMAQFRRAAELSPHDSARDASFAALPGADRDRRRQGPALERPAAARRDFVERGCAVVSLAKRLEEVFVPGRKRPIVLPARLGRASAAPAAARRGAPVRDRAPPAPPRPLDEGLDPRRAAGHRPRPQAFPPAPLRLARAFPAAPRAKSSRPSRACPARSLARYTSNCTEPA